MKNYIDFFKQKFLKTHKSDKRILAWISVLLVCLVIFWASYYSWIFKSLFNDVFVWFQVSWANFDLNVKKIPFNSKTIDLTFSKNIDKSSFSKDIFSISPNILWNISLKNSNTLSFSLQENLKLWQDYIITIKNTLKSVDWDVLDKDIIYILKTTNSPKVLKVIPDGNLENLNSNLWVFFSLPMVSLTSLENKDKLPCPLEITPKISWKCSWTTSSVLEFTPDKWFAWATNYNIKVKNISGLLYPLEKEFNSNFSTPDLNLKVEEKFIPKNYINLHFNFPVSINEVQKHISFSWAKVEVIPDKYSDISFFVKPVFWDFSYDTNYELKISAWLKPKYWNIPLKNDFNINLKSEWFVSSFEKYKNIYSTSWALVDNLDLTNDNFISTKNNFFKLSFYEEVLLDKKLFSFEDEAWRKVDFKLSYAKKELVDKSLVDDKQVLRFDISSELQNDKIYKLKILKSANNSLKQDLVYELKTPKKLKVLDYKFIDYSKSCLYLNNKVEEKTIKENIDFQDKSVLKNVVLWQYLDYKDEKAIEFLSIENKNQYLINHSYCPLAKDSQILYSIETRLNPNSSYKLKISKLTDIYENELGLDYSNIIKTWELKQKDKYVYSAFSNFANVFPSSSPVVLNFQTINLDKLYVDVCEMDELSYFNYFSNIYNENNTPKCLEKTSKTLKLTNHNWKLTSQKFDLYNDILWKNSLWKIFLINAYSNENKSKESSFSSNVILKTNLSLALEKASNKSLLFATSISDTKVIWDLDLTFYDFNLNKIKVDYTFNKEKLSYEISWDLSNFSYILAKNSNYSGLITNDDYFSNYDYKYISWQDSSTKNYLYIYTDRPIYRPEDEINIKWILREFNFDWYKKSQIKSWVLKIIDNDYSVYRTIEINVDDNWNFTTKFNIPKDSKLWDFRFQFEQKQDLTAQNLWINDVYVSWNFSIEEYKKPTFKVDIESKNNDLMIWDKASFKVSPKYYFGWKLVSTDWKYSILSQNYYFDAKDYSDYQFWENQNYFDCLYWGYCDYSDWLVESNSYKIDSNWEFKFNYDFLKKSEDSNEKIYTFNFDVTDKDSKKTVSNSVSKVVHNTDAYVWIKTDYYNDLKTWIKFDIVSLWYDAKPVWFKTVKVDFIKRDWQNVKKLWVDWVFYNDYSLIEKHIKSFDLITSWDKAEANYLLKPKDSWEYMIKTTYTWANKQTYVSSSIVYVWWDDYMSWRKDNSTVTDLFSDKTIYNLWETANFVLKSPVSNGKALFVIEKDDWIIDYFVHDIKSYWDKISLKITDKYYPNVYLKTYLIWTQKDNPLPVYKRALSVVKVLSDYKNLSVNIKTDKTNYLPQEKVNITVEVLDKYKKPVKNANLSLSVVDESVLALKWNPIKNPYAFFYDMKRYLWTLTYANLKYLVEKLEIKDTSSWEKWWAWDLVKWWQTTKPRWNFKDTALWIWDLKTDENWKAFVTIDKLPDNLTTWNIEALANTTTDNKIWVWYTSILTTKKVILEDNLPRFLNSSDEIVFSPIIYNKTWVDQNFEIKLNSTIWKVLLPTKNIFIKSWESKTINFGFVNVSSSMLKPFTTTKINIQTTWEKTKDSDSIEKKLVVYLWWIKESTSTIWSTKDVWIDEKIDLTWVTKNSWDITLTYSQTLFNYFLDALNFLSQYPYWCLEQKTSQINANIIIKKLYDASGVEFDLNKKFVKKYSTLNNSYVEVSYADAIKDYLAEMPKFLQSDWWFSYWYDWSYVESDYVLTSQVLQTLTDLKKLWFEVNQKILESNYTYLKTQFYSKNTCSEKIRENCLTLKQKLSWINAIISYKPNDYETYKMYKTLKLDKSLDNALTISKLSKNTEISQLEKDNLLKTWLEIVNEILNNKLIFSSRWAFISSDENSRVYNTSKLLQVMSELWMKNFKNNSEITQNMIRFLTFSKINSSFGSTSDNIKVLDAVWEYLTNTQEFKLSNFTWEFKLNQKVIASKKFDKTNIFDSYSQRIALNTLPDNNTISSNKTWAWTMYYDLSLNYFVNSKDISSRDEGFYIEKQYFSYDEYLKILALKKQEYEKYLSGEINFAELKYTKNVESYLTPLKSWKVWELALVYNKIINSESKDQVSFESFIPSWSEIVNTNLSTEDKSVSLLQNNFNFDRTELRDDRYFGFIKTLNPWFYDYSYVIRFTHSWKFEVKPTTISEFYHPENFGRTSWVNFEVK